MFHRPPGTETPPRGAIAATTLLWAVAACTDPQASEEAPLADFELATDRVVIHGRGRKAGDLCGGSTQWADQYIDSLSTYFDLPDGIVAKYFWYSDEFFAGDAFCGSAASCVRYPEWSEFPVIFSTQIPFEHEIVHALRMNSGTLCVPILEEGIAEFLGGVNAVGDVPGPMAHLLELSFDVDFESRSYTPGDYARARHFVSFLVEGYGLSAVLELCEAVPDGSSQEHFDGMAVEMLGRDMEGLLADYAAYPYCQSKLNRAKLFECGREPVVQVGNNADAEFVVDASCAGLDAVGPRWGRYYISKQIRLLDDGLYAFELEHPDELLEPDVIPVVNLVVEQCALCSEDPTSVEMEVMDSTFGIELRAGDYTVTFEFPVTELSNVSTTDLRVRIVGF